MEDPFNVVLKASKLPMSLLKDADKQSRMKLLQVTASSRFFSAEIREVFRVLRVVFVLSPCKKKQDATRATQAPPPDVLTYVLRLPKPGLTAVLFRDPCGSAQTARSSVNISRKQP